ncbi:MAG: MmcQ/YjbR family DNA-binding protein [Candidatus Promineifilaceae bacterium]
MVKTRSVYSTPNTPRTNNQYTMPDPLTRIRRICLALPETSERLSHGEPTYFVHKKVFVMFANNHHHDGHVAVWLPVSPGLQEVLIASAPEKYFKPPYVGVRGWVGIELAAVNDEELTTHIREAWRLIAPQKVQALL